MIRNAIVIVALLGCCSFADTKPPATQSFKKISVEYDLQFAEPSQETTRLQMTLSGRMGQAVRTTLDGMEHSKLEIETTAIGGPREPQYQTSLKLLGRESTDRRPDRWFCPQLRAVVGANTPIEIGPYKFQVTVHELK